MHAPCKIIARSGGNIPERHRSQKPKAVQNFIDRTVPADGDHIRCLIKICGQLTRTARRIPCSRCKKDIIIKAVSVQIGPDTIPLF